VLLAYAWSWAWRIPTVHLYRTATPAPGLMEMIVPVLIGAYGPTVAAIVLTAHREGWPGVKVLLRKFLIWRAEGGAWVVALLSPMLAFFIGIGFYARQGHPVGPFDLAGAWQIPLTRLMALPFGPLAEELGWRGYLQPALMARTSPAAVSLIIGAVWTFWHAPRWPSSSSPRSPRRPVPSAPRRR